MVVAAFITLLAAAPAFAEVKLAYVDIQRALNECNAGKQAKAQFQVKVQAAEGKLQAEQKQLQELKDELEKKGMLMKPEQRQNLQDEYVGKVRDFKRQYNDYREELARKDNEMTGRIVHDLAQIVQQIAQRQGYTMVLEKGSILWGAPSIDITDQVIKTYNEMHVEPGSIGANPKNASKFSSSSDFGAAAARRSTISK
jgi:outer membrane protein